MVTAFGGRLPVLTLPRVPGANYSQPLVYAAALTMRSALAAFKIEKNCRCFRDQAEADPLQQLRCGENPLLCRAARATWPFSPVAHSRITCLQFPVAGQHSVSGGEAPTNRGWQYTIRRFFAGQTQTFPGLSIQVQSLFWRR